MNEMTLTPPPLSLRLGRNGAQALDDLARLRRITRAEAARQAIEEAAERERKRRRDGLAEEASRLMSDPAWVSEAEEIVELLEELS
jgi:predicted transcriptional regulator